MGNLNLTASKADPVLRNLDPVVAKTDSATINHYSAAVKGRFFTRESRFAVVEIDSMLRNLNLVAPKIGLTPGNLDLVVVGADLATAQLPTGAHN